ncbi:MAG: HAMP domain-containing histidine kinase [Bacterioplanes sp.]|nr:HAMP domain-containing histidine kinase [Bacterioplanes sp.]
MTFDQLVASVIHDLKNQLQTLLDSEQAALQHIPERYHAHIVPILQRTSKLKTDTLQLVTLFRMGEQQSFCMDDAWPLDTVNDVIESVQLQFPQLQLNNRIDPQCQGFYNETLLHLAVLTLITNSAQAGANQVTIEGDDRQGLTLRVQDNGQGFSPDMLEHYQQGRVISTKTDGTGMGLYFVQLIAEHHRQGEQRGHIQLRNTEQGAEVTLWLP